MPCPKLYLSSRSDESTEEAAIRLRAEGRFDAKKVRQAEYRSEGRTANDACYMALNDFPPLVGPVDVVDPDESEDLSVPVLNLGSPDIRRDAYWAYNNIGRKGVKAGDAPSQGAWNMLKHFGANAGTIRDFLEEIAKPMLKSEPKGESYSDDGRELIALCERKRAEYKAEAAREEAA